MTPKYDEINAAWRAAPNTPITRLEAERAARRLFRRFGKVEDGSPRMTGPATFERVRACWVSVKGNRIDKGWPRLVHDVSHDIWEKRHPSMKPHGPAHAALELEITRYVLEAGWLQGKLRPRPPARPDSIGRQAIRMGRTMAGIRRWQTKLKRAQTALRKLEARRRRLIKAAQGARA